MLHPPLRSDIGATTGTYHYYVDGYSTSFNDHRYQILRGQQQPEPHHGREEWPSPDDLDEQGEFADPDELNEQEEFADPV